MIAFTIYLFRNIIREHCYGKIITMMIRCTGKCKWNLCNYLIKTKARNMLHTRFTCKKHEGSFTQNNS